LISCSFVLVFDDPKFLQYSGGDLLACKPYASCVWQIGNDRHISPLGLMCLQGKEMKKETNLHLCETIFSNKSLTYILNNIGEITAP
jgi:hypothetical protein